MSRSREVFLVVVAFSVVTSCGGGTNRVGLDESGGVQDTGISSQDLRTVTQRMARSIVSISVIAQAPKPPRVAFLKLKNNSSEIVDTNMFLERIRRLLLKHSGGRLRFLDRERVADIMREREAKRAGVVTSSGANALGGADYFLTGTISSIDKAAGELRSTYTRFSFRLTDAETSDIVWEDEYEMKKVGERAFWDR